MWAKDFLAKILASQFLPTFGRAKLGHEPNMSLTIISEVLVAWYNLVSATMIQSTPPL
jgi:hypothetical protein